MVEIRNTRTTHFSRGSTCLAAYIDWMSSGQIAASTIMVISIRMVGPKSRSTSGSRAMVGMVRKKSMTHRVLLVARRETPMSRPAGIPITAQSANPDGPYLQGGTEGDPVGAGSPEPDAAPPEPRPGSGGAAVGDRADREDLPQQQDRGDGDEFRTGPTVRCSWATISWPLSRQHGFARASGWLPSYCSMVMFVHLDPARRSVGLGLVGQDSVLDREGGELCRSRPG